MTQSNVFLIHLLLLIAAPPNLLALFAPQPPHPRLRATSSFLLPGPFLEFMSLSYPKMEGSYLFSFLLVREKCGGWFCFEIFFFFPWYWDLNQGYCTSLAGALPTNYFSSLKNCVNASHWCCLCTRTQCSLWTG